MKIVFYVLQIINKKLKILFKHIVYNHAIIYHPRRIRLCPLGAKLYKGDCFQISLHKTKLDSRLTLAGTCYVYIFNVSKHDFVKMLY